MERQLSHIYAIRRELTAAQAIPASYQSTLEERLPVAFRSFNRQSRLGRRRSSRQKYAYFRQKKANKVYSDVLETDPFIFIPFLLAISPRACEKFDISSFREQHHNTEGIRLRNGHFLHRIALTHGIYQVAGYKSLTDRLFETPTLPPPTTVAESDRHWALHASNLETIKACFGDTICDAVKSFPKQVQQEDQSPTECVTARLPRRDLQDCIFSIEIGDAWKLKDILFPFASSKQRTLGSEGGK